MRCPYCGNDDTQVKDSRPTEDSNAIRRRRICNVCGAGCRDRCGTAGKIGKASGNFLPQILHILFGRLSRIRRVLKFGTFMVGKRKPIQRARKVPQITVGIFISPVHSIQKGAYRSRNGCFAVFARWHSGDPGWWLRFCGGGGRHPGGS